MVKKLSEKLYRKIYSRVPRLCVDIILNSEEGIVLVKRDIPPCKDMWHLPGGTVLYGESLREAVKRVAKEETNLDIEIRQQMRIQEYAEGVGFGHVISVVYSANAVSGQMKGNRYGREVRAFNTIPTRTIEQQKALIENAESRAG